VVPPARFCIRLPLHLQEQCGSHVLKHVLADSMKGLQLAHLIVDDLLQPLVSKACAQRGPAMNTTLPHGRQLQQHIAPGRQIEHLQQAQMFCTPRSNLSSEKLLQQRAIVLSGQDNDHASQSEHKPIQDATVYLSDRRKVQEGRLTSARFPAFKAARSRRRGQ